MLDFLYNHQRWLIAGFLISGLFLGIYSAQIAFAYFGDGVVPKIFGLRWTIAAFIFTVFGFLLGISDP